MTKSELPRLVDVIALEPHRLELMWKSGGRSIVDVSDPVFRYRVLSPLRKDMELFARAHLVGYGSGVGWTDEIDISAITLARMSGEQGQPVLGFVDPFRTPELTTP